MEIDNIQIMVERALADGRLSRAERDGIMTAIYSDRKVSKEESKLWRELQQKIWLGEVKIDS
ncbi:MAG: hypothetical protein SW833_23365 [Cyanobacteriota bacterium]|nr:hypothetical protein [Cyanobacteriota bacterium]